MAVTVLFEEDTPESPSNEKWTEGGGFEATRQLRCKWEERHTLANQLLGFNGTEYGDPEAYPEVPGSYVRSISMSGGTSIETSAAGSTLNSYTEAILSVQYASRASGSTPKQPGTGIIMEESLEPSAEFLTLDGQEFYWEDATVVNRTPLHVNEAPGRIIRMVDWRVTLFNVTSIPSAFCSAAGSVNSSNITSLTLGVTFPAETLQFQPGTPSRQFTKNGPSKWKLSMSFSARPFSWNMFFRSGRSDPQNIYLANGDLYKPYTPINFATQLNVVY